MSVQTVTDQNFEEEVVKADVPTIVDFWAPWCGPCHRVHPILEEIAREHEGRLKVTKLDIDENRETAARFAIMSIPTVLLFQNGEVVEKIIGAQPREEFFKIVEKYVG